MTDSLEKELAKEERLMLQAYKQFNKTVDSIARKTVYKNCRFFNGHEFQDPYNCSLIDVGDLSQEYAVSLSSEEVFYTYEFFSRNTCRLQLAQWHGLLFEDPDMSLTTSYVEDDDFGTRIYRCVLNCAFYDKLNERISEIFASCNGDIIKLKQGEA